MIPSIKDQEKTVEVILQESQELQKILNEFFLKEFGKLHNIKPEFNKFELKQEVVTKQAYFLNVKKKYALNIVNLEGVPVNELDIKGLITRRSDYPEITKQGVMKILEMLIQDEKINFKKIRDYIKTKREEILELIQQRSKKIARPATFTKDISKYKKIPSHVLGMQLWNDFSYFYFVPGTKGYSFKIKGVDQYNKDVKKKLHKYSQSKNNYVVIPYEEDFLPEYYILDKEYSIKFAWDNRIDELIQPIYGKIYKEKARAEESLWED